MPSKPRATEVEPPPFPTKFAVNELVLCYHVGVLYDAKIVKIDASKGPKNVKYFIHYPAWNKKWDEWVAESQVLKPTGENRNKQKSIFENAKDHSSGGKRKSMAGGEASNKSKAPSTPKAETPTAAKKAKLETSTPTPASPKPATPSGRSRSGRASSANLDPAPDSETEAVPGPGSQDKDGAVEPPSKRTKQEIKVKIPEVLKPVLVDDWDSISRQKHLVTLPADPTVEDILEEYVASRDAQPDPFVRTEFVQGMREYFNLMLGAQLLYKFERPQYAQMKKNHEASATDGDDMGLSSIYGSIHLLRLFVKLGSVLSYTPLEPEETEMLLGVIHDFLDFLVEKKLDYFKGASQYQVASPDYNRKAMGN